MAARVQVIVETKETGSGVLRALANQFSGLGSLVEDLTSANINWGNIATSATQLVVEGLKKSISATQEYAASVRDLSLASGTTAEESSRLIQVLDDFEIRANDITTATKAMTKNGLAPTVETIAQLSDRYLQLNTAQERNAFIQENLGRGGAKWANVLKEGSAAILELNGNVDQNLILTQRNIDESENYRLALDNWNDAVQALEVSIGTRLLPVLTNLLTNTNDASNLTRNQMMVVANLDAALQRGTITTEQYNKVLKEHNIDLGQTAAAEKAAGSAAAAAATDYGKLLSMTEKLNGATREQIKLAAYQDLKAKLTASGGELTAEEAATLQAAGVALGVFDKNAVDAARSVDLLTAALADGKIELNQFIALLNGIPTNIDVGVNLTTPTSTGGIGNIGGGADGNVATPWATGTQGWNTVPAGYPNDKFLVALSSGEQYSVKNRAQQSMSDNQTTTGGLNNNYFYGNNTFIISSETGSDLAGVRL